MEQIKINIYNAIGSSFAMEASDGQLIYDKITKLFDEQKSIMLDLLFCIKTDADCFLVLYS